MYQQPGIRICYADALVHDHAAYPEIQNGTFDILVANPPFSVKGFLETLPDESPSHYRLTDMVNDTDTANSIETFFVERATQLLRPGGIAAIILPASILSNGGSSYTAAREMLRASFEVIAIAEFGSGTFGKPAPTPSPHSSAESRTNPHQRSITRSASQIGSKASKAIKGRRKSLPVWKTGNVLSLEI